MKLNSLIKGTLCITTLLLGMSALNTASAKRLNTNFNSAKGYLYKITRQLNEPKTVYCGCDITITDKWYYPDLESCGYVIQYNNPKRAKRIEAEHIVPASYFGKKRECWIKRSGRKNCEDTDSYFNLIESDLHNLYPSVGEVNNERQNFAFSDTVRKASPFGQCDMLIDRKRQRVTPPERSRGVIARAYLYMSMMYGIDLDAEHVNLFNRWNKEYRPDMNECRRNLLIKEIQGNENPFISEKCKYGKEK